MGKVRDRGKSKRAEEIERGVDRERERERERERMRERESVCVCVFDFLLERQTSKINRRNRGRWRDICVTEERKRAKLITKFI